MRIKKTTTKQQYRVKTAKCLWLFKKFKSTGNIEDEIEDANNNVNDGQVLFIGSNKEKFNFNTFNKPLNFISAIYNDEISLKEAEFKQRDLEKK